MALISCPECGKEVSDQALACIHCGYPLQSFPPPKRAPRQYSLVFTGLGPHADIPAALHCLSKELGLSQKDAQALLERATLMIGTDEDKVSHAIEVIKGQCGSRKQIIATSAPMVGMPSYTSFPISVDVGGATIFVLDVERFEKI